MINELSTETDKLEREYKLKKRTYDLLPNAEKNIVQLQEIASQSSEKLVELAKEWYHRANDSLITSLGKNIVFHC